jgi:ABC-2 type transport system ATP-binding protein
VVLLDEPTVGVDPQSRQRIWDMLTQLRDLGASLLLTTHQLDEAQQICDRIVIIDHGKAIATGKIEQLVEQTIGRSRLVTISFDQPLPADVPIAGGDVMPGRKSAAWRMADVGSELAELLAQLAEQNLPVADVHIESPSLHAVFLHLTGRELRE